MSPEHSYLVPIRVMVVARRMLLVMSRATCTVQGKRDKKRTWPSRVPLRINCSAMLTLTKAMQRKSRGAVSGGRGKVGRGSRGLLQNRLGRFGLKPGSAEIGIFFCAGEKLGPLHIGAQASAVRAGYLESTRQRVADHVAELVTRRRSRFINQTRYSYAEAAGFAGAISKCFKQYSSLTIWQTDVKICRFSSTPSVVRLP